MTKNILKNSPFVLTLLVALIVGTSSCKTKKNLSQVTPVEEVEPIDENETEELEEVPEVKEIRVPEKIVSIEQKLNNYFNAIQSSSTTESANSSISEALNMFNSPDAPVLVVIYNDGTNPDYDEPTTISKYLNYLKDTKSKPAEVEEAVYDSNGLIKELVLKK
ncbi:MAG: nucleoid-structuring protein H-NS [Reichenbachiella sp.]|uniref:nucleoid-structuring protein H-NS n=1 Tax=Reichenbachiella sp. TaxID=2184521 RepID=UPI0032988793